MEGFWYLNTPCIRKSTTLNNVYELLERWIHSFVATRSDPAYASIMIPCRYLRKKLHTTERHKSGIYWLGISRFSMTGVSVGLRPPCWGFMDFIHWFLCWVCIIIVILYYYMKIFCNLIGLEQWYFSLIWNSYMWKLQTFCR